MLIVNTLSFLSAIEAFSRFQSSGTFLLYLQEHLSNKLLCHDHVVYGLLSPPFFKILFPDEDDHERHLSPASEAVTPHLRSQVWLPCSALRQYLRSSWSWLSSWLWQGGNYDPGDLDDHYHDQHISTRQGPGSRAPLQATGWELRSWDQLVVPSRRLVESAVPVICFHLCDCSGDLYGNLLMITIHSRWN